MRELTNAEEQIMQVLWKIEKGFVKDIIEYLPDPKPAYNTVSTIIRILEKKGIVSHKAYGKSHEYFPLISRDEYKKSFLKIFLKNYFGNSFKDMVSFFAKDQKMSVKELEEIQKMFEDVLSKQKRDEND